MINRKNYIKILPAHVIINVDEGWHQIISVMLDMLMKYNIQIDTIKEKFGGLVVYFEEVPNPLTDEEYNEISKIIEYSQRIAAKTCEVCSNNQSNMSANSHGNLKILCETCRHDYEYNIIK